MDNQQFLRLTSSVWNNNEIRKLSPSTLIFLIDLLFISYSFNHKPFYQSPKDLYKKCRTYHMAFYRIKRELENVDIYTTFDEKVYSFDLTLFFKKYSQV